MNTSMPQSQSLRSKQRWLWFALSSSLYGLPAHAKAPQPASTSVCAATQEPWVHGLRQRVATIAAQDPALATALQNLAPATTRDRMAKFTSPLLRQAGALSVLALRLVDPNTPASWRPALAQALEQSGDPELAATVAALLECELDVATRSNLAFALRRVVATPADASNSNALSLGLRDESAIVRGMTLKARAYQAARSPLRLAIDDEVVRAIDENDPRIIEQALWAAEMLKREDAVEPALRQINHAAPTVRLAALRLVHRIAPARLSGGAPSGPLAALVNDSDRRVAALARSIRSKLGGKSEVGGKPAAAD